MFISKWVRKLLFVTLSFSLLFGPAVETAFPMLKPLSVSSVDEWLTKSVEEAEPGDLFDAPLSAVQPPDESDVSDTASRSSAGIPNHETDTPFVALSPPEGPDYDPDIADTTPPTAPSNLALIDATVTSIGFAWDAAHDDVGIAQYNIYLDSVFVHTVVSSTYSYEFTYLLPNTVYEISVSATDAAGNESAQSSPLMAQTEPLPVATPPSAPANLLALNVTETKVVLSWEASVGHTAILRYEILDGESLIGTVSGETSSYTIEGLLPNETYVYTVQAIDFDGLRSNASVPLTVATLADQQPPFYDLPQITERRPW